MGYTRTPLLGNEVILETESLFDRLTYWGLCCLLFIGPFFNGLFFPDNQRVALLAAAILFLFASIISFQRKNVRFFSNPLDYLVLALPVVYIIASFSAVNYALAIDEVFENILYFFVFWTAVRVIRTSKHIEKIFAVLFFNGVCVALAGLFVASGWLDIKDAYSLRDGGTIASVFQYKNTLASFLTAIIFIGFYLTEEYKNKLTNYFFSSSTYLLLLVFFSTQSHGGYIIFGIFSSLLWLLYPDNKRFILILSNILLALFAFLGSKMFLLSIMNKNVFQAWLWVMTGIIITSLYQWIINKYKSKAPHISLKQILIFLLGMLLGGTFALYHTGIFDILLEKIHMFGAMERFTTYEDSFKMIQERPFIGWGGGGWAEAYTIFQSYAYNVRVMHSYFLQATIEAGLLGLLIIIAIWGMFIKLAYRVFKFSRTEEKLMAATLICAILAILSHSVIDFNLSLAALTMILFTLVGCMVRLDQNFSQESPKEKGKLYSGYTLVASIIVTLVIFTGSLIMISSDNLYDAAIKALNARQGQEAIALTEKAITMNPMEAKTYGLAAQLYSAFKMPKQAVENADKAIELAPYNPDRYLEAAVIYVRAGETEKAVTTAERAIQLAPLKVKYYEQYSDTLINVALRELQNKQPKTVANYTKETIAIPDKITAVLKKISPEKKKLWIYAQPLAVTDKIKLNIGIANLIQGNLVQAAQNINEASQNPQINKDSLVWQALIAQKQGDISKAENLLKSAEKENPNIKKQYNQLLSLIAS
ncbi:O-antigen polymerase [Desulforamulus reducens MI-1]|uniref:O-antigen polymerase n=1 Tax=Desulforamulus reducens (strain ATCC BAA-1160 / DSM 100696 / MI-1) TaxID=349161 RepID=A4J987_DESRM|nr:O-antigen ligase family protein [Desulforamulus reducens]ABO51640.1 O-antigen polymerase [Desulforamulus reducens MI-1]